MRERSEQAVDSIRRDADAGVCDRESQSQRGIHLLHAFHTDGDRTGHREFHRVADEVDEHLSESVGIAECRDAGARVNEAMQ